MHPRGVHFLHRSPIKVANSIIFPSHGTHPRGVQFHRLSPFKVANYTIHHPYRNHLAILELTSYPNVPALRALL